jgi:nucleotidyltransferase/DNA polymerase involved in DNA repair
VFGALLAAEGTDRALLESVAREFSPRVEVCGAREITVDLSGLTRLFGDARTIAQELRRTAADRGLRVRVAIAGTRSAARLFVHHRAGITVIDAGTEAEMLASLPLTLLDSLTTADSHLRTAKSANRSNASNASNSSNGLLSTLRRWGLRTLGEFAALPSDAVAARLGQPGVAWQCLARGEDARPLVPSAPEERFEQTLDLEWPIDGLEPLSFVLGRMMERLATHLERRDRGAAVLHVRLHLVTRVVHERSLQLPAPMRDARALRTLALLDLESHPPDAAIDRVTVAVDPTPGRVVQFSLLTRPLPSPEHLSTLTARLAALMGEGRGGSPVPVDSWRPGAFAMKPFAPRDIDIRHSDERSVPLASLQVSVSSRPVAALRRFRIPIRARVRMEEGRPIRVVIDRHGFRGGRVDVAAGPWRTSGAWWESSAPVSPKPRSGEGGWSHDEWDVALADGVTYRVFHDRDADAWFVEGVVD